MATTAPSPPPETPERGVAPIVRLPRPGVPAAVLAVAAIVAAVILFLILDTRRRAIEMPSVRPRPVDSLGASAQLPPLYVPPALPPPVVIAAPPPPPPVRPAPPPPQIIYVPQMIAPSGQRSEPPPAVPPRVTASPALVVDTSQPESAGAAPGESEGAAAGAGTAIAVAGTRSRAGALANRATTVPQGTLIPAVLETAFDSTRPGFARAIVSRDVRGWDGSRVLIPRGSRLFGEYRSDATPGQKRALVTWTRLIRPDGATIAIGSPAGDTLGRGGIKARVNNHFFERFSGALLQTALNVGTAFAYQASNSPIIVALPGTLQQTVGPVAQPTQVTPTLKVRQGTSITVFVARDLDFTGAENRR